MTSASTIAAHGIEVTLPPEWEARIFQRPVPTADQEVKQRDRRSRALGWPGEQMAPGLHAGTFALPGGRGDFGTGVLDVMSARHAFVALLEYGPQEVGSALFEPAGALPRPQAGDFSPSCLQRRLPGQLGYQRFFTTADRALCLFVVVGSLAHVAASTRQVNQLLDGVVLS